VTGCALGTTPRRTDPAAAPGLCGLPWFPTHARPLLRLGMPRCDWLRQAPLAPLSPPPLCWEPRSDAGSPRQPCFPRPLPLLSSHTPPTAGTSGGAAIAQLLLSNTVLRQLNLSWNNIRGAGAVSLMASLATNRTLKVGHGAKGHGVAGGVRRPSAMGVSPCAFPAPAGAPSRMKSSAPRECVPVDDCTLSAAPAPARLAPTHRAGESPHPVQCLRA
jgi:hypothetical protein